MKRLKLLSFLIILSGGLTLNSCIYHSDDNIPSNPDYQGYKAIYMSRQQLESSIKISQPRSMTKAGKIYVKDQYIFITDENKGFHIYDNTNPNAPQLVAFLEVPGATDMAIKNNTMFINQAIDLVAVTVTNNNVVVQKRIPNTFPQKISPDGYYYSSNENNIIVDWKY